MVLLALRRASLDWLLIDEFDRLSGQVYTQQQAGDTADISSRKRRMKEEHWTIQRDEEHDTIKIINDDDNVSSSAALSNAEMHTTQELIHTLQTIRHLTTKSLPELSSRIIHATSPIVHELSRGYFVPFLTVALACLGRIHVLILRLGRELVGTLSQHVPKLRDCVADCRKKEKGGDGSLIKLKEALTPFIFSMHTMEEGTEPSNEWNELMKPFTEITHDEFTKNMCNFVKDRRWKDAITAFGIKKDDLDELQLLSRQQSDSHGIDDGDDGNGGESMNIDDMGELVYMQQKHDDKKDDTMRSNVDVDENLARVLDKRRIDETTSSTTTAKKKKRRRKKKKSAGDSEGNEDAANNAVKVADDEGAKAESKQSDDNIKKIAEEDVKTASKQSNSGLDSSTDAQLQNSRLSPKESSNSGDEAMIDAQQSKVDAAVTKKEKKSKKKKTKKKKSKNVIDDIFG